MDAVQAANSGHPGTPMALAPVTYTLWQRFLRFDPERRSGPTATGSCCPPGTPRRCSTRCCTWPGSSRSTREYESARRARGLAGGPQAVPAARLQVPRPPRVPVDRRRRVHHRATGHRHRHQRRHGHRRAVAGRHLQPARLRPVRLRRLRPRRRRLPDGRHRRRGRLPGRAPEAGQPVLDLRQQPDHHRGRHRAWRSPRTCRPGSPATAGPCSTSPTPTTWTRWRARSRRSRPRGPADADHRRQRHRLRRARQAGHATPRTANRWVSTRSRATKRFYGWPEDETFLVPDGVPSTSPAGVADARRRLRAVSGRQLFARYAAEYPDLAEQLNRMQRRTLPDGWDADLPAFPADPRASPAVTPTARCSTRSPGGCRG